MWQLELLRDVIPAFEVLTYRLFRERDGDGDGDGHGNHLVPKQCLGDCYVDMMNIHAAVSLSGGEWKPGLDEAVITRLLKGLERRFPTRSRLRSFISFTVGTTAADDPAKQFPELHALQARVQATGSVDSDDNDDSGDSDDDDGGGAAETSVEKKLRRALDGMESSIYLFRREKTPEDTRDREKFLKIIKTASRHLLQLYSEPPQADDAPPNLASHPSSGVKKLANDVYGLLGKHWKCGCYRLPPAGTREARLSLTRHRQFQLKAAAPRPAWAQESRSRDMSANAKFEVLLPTCKDCVVWKVTDVHVMASAREAKIRTQVQSNLCQLLLESDAVQVRLLAEYKTMILWHVPPPAPLEASDHAAMDSLHQLLGDDPTAPSAAAISRYNDKERLTLAYILATSALYLYPGAWLQTASCWSSDKIFFPQRGSGWARGQPVALTRPYISADLLRRSGKSNNDPSSFVRYHRHPAVLALGIMLLEIATSTKFDALCGNIGGCGGRKLKEGSWMAAGPSNADGLHALNALKKLESHSSRQVPSYLRETIRACLELRPPSYLPEQSLSEEGPLRFYVLSCVVAPLAMALDKAYGVRLDSLAEDEEGREDGRTESLLLKVKLPDGTAGRPEHSATRHIKLSRVSEASCVQPDLLYTGNSQVSKGPLGGARGGFFDDDTPDKYTEELCKFSDEFLARHKHIYESMISSTGEVEHKLHASGIGQPEPRFPDRGSRIKVAILDTGLDVSHPDIKAREERIKDVRSWVDGLDGKQDRNAGDSCGHGTHVTSLLLDFAPDSDVYVARIAKDQPESPGQIAKAVMHAVTKWQVDIISMSFGLTDETEPGCDDFLEAIEAARAYKILMFAAASNNGSHSRPAFPARHDGVFCIFATDGKGNCGPANPTAEPHAYNFSTLGQAVKSAWPEGLREGRWKRRSGTSFAVPVAAGMVATILLYARRELSGEEARRFKEYAKMRDMLHALSDFRGGYNVISMARFFGEALEHAVPQMRMILAGTWRK